MPPNETLLELALVPLGLIVIAPDEFELELIVTAPLDPPIVNALAFPPIVNPDKEGIKPTVENRQNSLIVAELERVTISDALLETSVELVQTGVRLAINRLSVVLDSPLNTNPPPNPLLGVPVLFVCITNLSATVFVLLTAAVATT